MFSVESNVAPEKLQLEFTEQKYDSILHIFSFNQEALISFYALVSSFSGLCKLA
jgi:hypothetical protein